MSGDPNPTKIHKAPVTVAAKSETSLTTEGYVPGSLEYLNVGDHVLSSVDPVRDGEGSGAGSNVVLP